MTTSLYYIHDPMCSWCWAFRPALNAVHANLPKNLHLTYLLGGLAKDTDEPMPDILRHQIQNHWRTIQTRIPDTKFNFDFWKKCQPRRNTYPACRAVLAAKAQDIHCEATMIEAIQHAYYLQARNPSDTETLIELADELGLDVEKFSAELNSEKTRELLKREIIFVRKIGGNSFPMLLLGGNNTYHQILIDYIHPDKMLEEINHFLATRYR
jgi:putative protein-disulfide isomerase